MADQQFCLRWNNHQNTLISVFDSLLEGEILVDCTLAAEGRFLRAHKVVLSACSPFFSDLLRQHYEKHPILIMKDVKFDQLKAMLDYMYRGEVNISQDQLGSFLKAAESLQIKGLSDSAQNFDSHSKQKSSNESRTPRTSSVPEDDATKRPNNTSPTPRQKKRRRLSGSGDETVPEETSNDQVLETGTPLSKTSVNCRLSNPASPPNSSVTNKEDDVDPPEASTSVSNRVQPVPSAVLLNKSEPSRQQPPSILDSEMFVPKSEFIELDGDEDLTEDGDNMEAGPSHSNSDAGGYSWHVDRPDESFLSPELATQRNAQGGGVGLRGARVTLAHALQDLSRVLKNAQNFNENSSPVLINLAGVIGSAIHTLNSDLINPYFVASMASPSAEMVETVEVTTENEVNKPPAKKKVARPGPKSKTAKGKAEQGPKTQPKSKKTGRWHLFDDLNLDLDIKNKIWLEPQINLTDVLKYPDIKLEKEDIIFNGSFELRV